MSEAVADHWVGDHFERRGLAQRLLTVVQTMKSGGVIGIDAPFGYGKTFFVRGLMEELRARGIKTAYFDAWKADLASHPLFLFVSEILAQLTEQGLKVEGSEDLGKKIGALSSAVARIGLKSVLRAGDDDLDAVLEPFASEVDRLDFSKKGAAAEARNLADQVDAARRAFSRAVDTMLAGVDGPLFVVIDELDRARPDFSIELIEALKFVFATTGVVFCVAVDRKNLSHVIRARFGDGYVVDQYLAKLFSFWIRLENPREPLKFFASRLRDAGLVQDGLLVEGDDLFKGLESVTHFGFAGLGEQSDNLRAIERCVERAAICTRALGKGQWACLSGLFCGLSVRDEGLLRYYVGHKVENFRPGLAFFQTLRERLPFSSEWTTAMAIALTLPPRAVGDAQAGIAAVYGETIANEVSSSARMLMSQRHLSSRSAAALVFDQVGWALG